MHSLHHGTCDSCTCMSLLFVSEGVSIGRCDLDPMGFPAPIFCGLGRGWVRVAVAVEGVPKGPLGKCIRMMFALLAVCVCVCLCCLLAIHVCVCRVVACFFCYLFCLFCFMFFARVSCRLFLSLFPSVPIVSIPLAPFLSMFNSISLLFSNFLVCPMAPPGRQVIF